MEMPAASPAAAAPPWIMLRRVVCEQQDPSVEMAGYLSLAPATPPRASILNLREGALRWLADDDSNNRVTAIAADTAGLLLHAFAYPFMGIEEGGPVTLVVASDFGRADAGHEGLTPSTILRIPNRGRPASAQLSNLSSIQNFGLVSRPGSGGAEYVVAELRTPYSGEDNAWVISFTSGAEAWVPRELKCPSSTSPLLWLWDTHDVVAHNGTLWWVDLTIGLLGCDLFADEPALHHVEPPAFPVGRMEVASLDNFELAQRRLVRVSRGMLRFVAVSCLCDKPTEEPLVLIWRLVQGPSGEPIWEHQCSTSLTTIWASDRYKDTGMPQEVPVLGLLDPENPDLVYFFLDDNIFSINVSDGKLIDFFRTDLRHGLPVNMLPRVISWQDILIWDSQPLQDHENLQMLIDDFVARINTSISDQEVEQPQIEHDLPNVGTTSEANTTTFLVKLPVNFNVDQSLVPSTHYTYATARALLDDVKRRPLKWVSRQVAYALLSNAATFVLDCYSDEEGRCNGSIVVVRSTYLIQLGIDYTKYSTTGRHLKERRLKDNKNSLIDRYEISGNLCTRRRVQLRDNTEFQLLQWRVKRQVPGELPANPPDDSSADIVKALQELTASNKEIAASHRAIADSFKEFVDQEKRRMDVIIQNHTEVMAAATKECRTNK